MLSLYLYQEFAGIYTSTVKKTRNLQIWDKSGAIGIGFSARENDVSCLFNVDAEQNHLEDLILGTVQLSISHTRAAFPCVLNVHKPKNVSMEFGTPVDDLGDLHRAVLSSCALCWFFPRFFMTFQWDHFSNILFISKRTSAGTREIPWACSQEKLIFQS